ncbi:unnamed protein product [Gadus morhua 'NCC']
MMEEETGGEEVLADPPPPPSWGRPSPSRSASPCRTTGLGSRRGGVAAAVPLGGPNTSELCMWSESHHHLDGIPRNPHHLERVPGGSSGILHMRDPGMEAAWALLDHCYMQQR